MTTSFAAAEATVASVVGLALCAVWKGTTTMTPLEASDAGAAEATAVDCGGGLGVTVE